MTLKLPVKKFPIYNFDIVKHQQHKIPYGGGSFLLKIMKEIDGPFRDYLFYRDSTATVIYDGYPKAKYHLLMIPTDIKSNSSLVGLHKLTVNHISMLQHFVELSKEIEDHLKVKLNIGFHAVPSATLLHMHLISDDFDSPYLKTKKHWNSFTTPFFIHPKKVIDSLSKSFTLSSNSNSKDLDVGELILSIDNLKSYEKYIDGDMKCQKTGKILKNMKELKAQLDIINRKDIKIQEITNENSRSFLSSQLNPQETKSTSTIDIDTFDLNRITIDKERENNLIDSEVEGINQKVVHPLAQSSSSSSTGTLSLSSSSEKNTKKKSKFKDLDIES